MVNENYLYTFPKRIVTKFNVIIRTNLFVEYRIMNILQCQRWRMIRLIVEPCDDGIIFKEFCSYYKTCSNLIRAFTSLNSIIYQSIKLTVCIKILVLLKHIYLKYVWQVKGYNFVKYYSRALDSNVTVLQYKCNIVHSRASSYTAFENVVCVALSRSNQYLMEAYLMMQSPSPQ